MQHASPCFRRHVRRYCLLLEEQEVEEAVSLMEAQQIRRLPISVGRHRHPGRYPVHVRDTELSRETLEAISEPSEPKR